MQLLVCELVSVLTRDIAETDFIWKVLGGIRRRRCAYASKRLSANGLHSLTLSQQLDRQLPKMLVEELNVLQVRLFFRIPMSMYLRSLGLKTNIFMADYPNRAPPPETCEYLAQVKVASF